MPLLALEKDDPQKELEFDVKCVLEVAPSDRLDQWLEWNISMLRFIEQQRRILYGHEKTSQIPERK